MATSRRDLHDACLTRHVEGLHAVLMPAAAQIGAGGDGAMREYLKRSLVRSAGLSLLLLGRLAWRWSQGAFGAGSAQAAQQASPLTLGIAATLIAYSLVYTSGLLLRMRKLTPEPVADP